MEELHHEKGRPKPKTQNVFYVNNNKKKVTVSILFASA